MSQALGRQKEREKRKEEGREGGKEGGKHLNHKHIKLVYYFNTITYIYLVTLILLDCQVGEVAF